MRWAHRCNAEADSQDLRITAGDFNAILADIRKRGFAETAAM
ncbi:hypothetical protein [Sphingomonas sp.]